MTRENHLVRTACVPQLAYSKFWSKKKSLEQFLAEQIVFEKKNQSLFVMNGTKCS